MPSENIPILPPGIPGIISKDEPREFDMGGGIYNITRLYSSSIPLAEIIQDKLLFDAETGSGVDGGVRYGV